jgi:hypothetical protein
MTTITLSPDPQHCRPFYVVHQLHTGAWGHGPTETEARARMMELRRGGRLIYEPEPDTLSLEESKRREIERIGLPE